VGGGVGDDGLLIRRRPWAYFVATEDGFALELPLADGGTELVYLHRYKDKRFFMSADHFARGSEGIQRLGRDSSVYERLLNLWHLFPLVLKKGSQLVLKASRHVAPFGRRRRA
jgi:hypothetical protein